MTYAPSAAVEMYVEPVLAVTYVTHAPVIEVATLTHTVTVDNLVSEFRNRFAR